MQYAINSIYRVALPHSPQVPSMNRRNPSNDWSRTNHSRKQRNPHSQTRQRHTLNDHCHRQQNDTRAIFFGRDGEIGTLQGFITEEKVPHGHSAKWTAGI